MKEQLLSQLPVDFPWRDRIHWFETIDSTNTRAKAMAAEGAPHGTVLIANAQTGGRGRMGRSFESPKDTGLYLSVILRPDCAPEEIMHLTCAAGVAACQAISDTCGFRPGIKWINDLVHDKKKLGGILVELSVNPKTCLVDHAVIGIGINCSETPAQVQEMATSLSQVTGKTIDRSALASAILLRLEQMASTLLSDNTLMAQYRADCITLGQQIRVERAGAVRYGTALDIDSQGGLLVVYDDGSRETVQSGEVSVRGMYGYI